MKWVKRVLAGLVILVAILFSVVWFSTYHPGELDEMEVVCPKDTPTLKSGQTLRVLNWNVQYMASKNYVFFYDHLDSSGPDERPSSKDIAWTFGEVARVIKDTNPDIILLQELDEDAARTDYEDQLTRLMGMLPKDYKCHTSALYWKAAFVPHPRIMGSVGMKVSTISKYKIGNKEGVALRHRLPVIPATWVEEQMGLKRAILEVEAPVDGAKPVKVLNTHLDAFAQGSDTMERQVAITNNLLTKLSKEGYPFLIGGDFNLLPPGIDPKSLGKFGLGYYKPTSEIKMLFENPAVKSSVSLAELTGPNKANYFTHFPNAEGRANGPDRTIDYVFLSEDMEVVKHETRLKDTLKISDHFPIIVDVKLP